VDQESEARTRPALGIAQHRQVTIGVAEGQKRTAANVQGDVGWLHLTVIEAVQFRQLHDDSSIALDFKPEFHAGSDNLLAGDAVSLVREGSDEVHATARNDVGLEPVLPQKLEQL